MKQSEVNQIESTVQKERGRLLGFIRKRVPATEDAEDILQDVFYQFIDGYNTIESIEKVSSWLLRVAKNKITDWYRKKRPVTFSKVTQGRDDEDIRDIESLIPSFSSELPDESFYWQMMWEKMEEALDELPEVQKEVFVKHEFEQMSFKEMAAQMGETVNTLLSRKRYATLHLRERLSEFYVELKN